MGHKVHITPKKDAAYRAAAGEQAASDGMTRTQAEAEAKRLWGTLYGMAWFSPYGKQGDLDYCRVGLGVGETRDLWKPFGRGKTFEAAFLDARQRGYCE